MPVSAPSPCRYPGCRELVRGGGCCPLHKREQSRVDQDRRGTAASRGYSSKWVKARATYLRSHPLCAECSTDQRPVAAEVVDHIVPHRGDQSLFWDTDNWQPLCKQCHDRKTACEDGGFGNARREQFEWHRGGGGSKV